MRSSRGFLARRSDGGLRMTASQIESVRRGVDEAINQRHGDESADVLALVDRVVLEALNGYPTDRSCETCDLFVSEGRHCMQWKAEVPVNAIDAGCKHWQDHGAPF